MIRSFRSPNGIHSGIRLISVLILMALFIVSAGRSLAAEPPQPRKVATVEGITEFQFDNGLRLLLFPDHSQSKVTVNMTVLVGSRHEGYGESGMAHLLEHMLFKGTPTHTNIPQALRQRGARFNGTTMPDRVNYFETMAASDENLEFAIRLEADRLVNSLIRKEDLDSEMTVVRNEFERNENSPEGVLMKRIIAAAYDWHNYGKTSIGNRSDIERAPIESLRAFYRKHYHPDNVVLIVAGKFEEARVLALVQKYFGPLPRPSRKLDATWTEEPPQEGERFVTLRRVGDAGMVDVAYHVPAGPHEDTAALEVLANLLCTRPSGGLYKALVETKKATSVSVAVQGMHDPTLLVATAQVPRDGALDEVRDMLVSTIEGVGIKGPTAEEVDRAKTAILKQRELKASDTATNSIALSDWVAQGDWRLYFLHRDRIEQVTPKKVQAVAARYLVRNNRTVGILIPTDHAEGVAIPPSPDVSALVADYKGRGAIAEGESFDATPENIELRVSRPELPEGIKATLLPKRTRGQEVDLTLTLRFGNEENLKGLEPAAGLLGELMLRGTRNLSDQQISDQLDRLTASLGVGGDGGGGRGGRRGGGGGTWANPPGTLTFSIKARRDTLPAVLEILRQVLREPLLSTDQFEILKRQGLADLGRMKTQPGMLAQRLLACTLNPHPKDNIRYVPTVEESVARLQAATPDDVVRLHREYLGSQQGELTIVGDFDPDACLPVLKNALAGWKAAKPYARIADPVTTQVAGSEHTIVTPGKPNANYRAGLLFPLRDDAPDYPALLMGNYIFGGSSWSSRLAARVRQKEGLSYTVVSTLNVSSQDQRAALSILASANPQNIAMLKQCVDEELARLLKDGVTEDELDKERESYFQSRKVGRSSDTALSGALSGLRHLDRTMAWETDLEKKITSLTADHVNAALRRHFDPKKIVVITAGDFEGKAAGGVPP